MTNPVLNLQSPLVDKDGKVIPPWNSFFQQFTQKAPAVETITKNPFTPNQIGHVVFTNAITISFVRGDITIDMTGQQIIPMGIGDIVSWTGPAVVQFLG